MRTIRIREGIIYSLSRAYNDDTFWIVLDYFINGVLLKFSYFMPKLNSSSLNILAQVIFCFHKGKKLYVKDRKNDVIKRTFLAL